MSATKLATRRFIEGNSGLDATTRNDSDSSMMSTCSAVRDSTRDSISSLIAKSDGSAGPVSNNRTLETNSLDPSTRSSLSLNVDFITPMLSGSDA